MNLIEKVARAIENKLDSLPFSNGIEDDKNQYKLLAQAAISAMPSIKWQKIETLPELDRASSKTILFWVGSSHSKIHKGYWHNSHQKFYSPLVDVLYPINYVTHWAEINAPEEE